MNPWNSNPFMLYAVKCNSLCYYSLDISVILSAAHPCNSFAEAEQKDHFLWQYYYHSRLFILVIELWKFWGNFTIFTVGSTKKRENKYHKGQYFKRSIILLTKTFNFCFWKWHVYRAREVNLLMISFLLSSSFFWNEPCLFLAHKPIVK